MEEVAAPPTPQREAEVITIDDDPDDNVAAVPTTPQAIKQRIEGIVALVIQDLAGGRTPYLEIRTAQNNNTEIGLRKIELYMARSQATFTSVLCLMLKCYDLICRNEYQNKRDIFYENIQLYRNQRQLDSLIKLVCAVVKVPRWDLNIEASPKGLIVGALTWKDGRDDVRQVTTTVPALIPSNQKGFHDFKSDAKFILVVEKDAVFQKVVEENCFDCLGSFLLVTGKGYPDYGTRRFLKKLSDSLHLRTFLLVDADPHGLQIASIYRWGTRGSWEPELCLPNLELLGLLPSELDYIAYGEGQRLTVTAKEISQLNALETRIRDEDWKREIEVLRTTRVKAEIESISTSSPNFLTNVYLKSKIDNKFMPVPQTPNPHLIQLLSRQ